MANERKPLFEQVAQKLIDQLEKGTSPFQKPWNDHQEFMLPFNPTTGKAYRGMNSIWLMMQGHQDPRWLTYKQAQSGGWNVEKGAKGTLINYVKLQERQQVRDENGNPMLDEKGNPLTQMVRLERPVITSAFVFNAKDIRGIPSLEVNTSPEQKWEDIKGAEELVRNSRAKIHHGGNKAFYNPAADTITLPRKNQFTDAARYYAVLLHEMGHWTGHSSRLNRPMVASFGTEYAREELRAEIASLMTGSHLKLGHDFGRHAAYVKSWASILKNEPFELYCASSDAQKITDYILSFQHKRNIQEANTRKHPFQFRERVRHNGADYEISGLLPGHRIQVDHLQSGKLIRLSPEDGLYRSLMKAKQGQTEPESIEKAVKNEPVTQSHQSLKR
ncbi:ArdC family protein [Gaoshiqia sp. Z1-71]|uniref:ArdC family protein n=1 Tax=Gaoshiqia hydrogeniformans TaxID=3290090 RepID=UPI003BF7E773